jgi:hypothetical protein
VWSYWASVERWWLVQHLKVFDDPIWGILESRIVQHLKKLFADLNWGFPGSLIIAQHVKTNKISWSCFRISGYCNCPAFDDEEGLFYLVWGFPESGIVQDLKKTTLCWSCLRISRECSHPAFEHLHVEDLLECNSPVFEEGVRWSCLGHSQRLDSPVI